MRCESKSERVTCSTVGDQRCANIEPSSGLQEPDTQREDEGGFSLYLGGTTQVHGSCKPVFIEPPPLSNTMSDDEVDHELLDLLRKRFGIGVQNDGPPETKVLESAEFIYDNSIDVALDMRSTKVAAQLIIDEMEKREYSTKTWSSHELHPKAKDESTVNFIFTMDLLNFSFWSEKSEEERFAVDYKDQRWTGYWGLVAVLQRALDEDVPITSPEFWIDEESCTDEVLRNAFRSMSEEEVPMLAQRIKCLREAGRVLDEVGRFHSTIVSLLAELITDD